MPQLSISKKHFIVTGGASGLGAATVSRLVKEGAKVTVFDWVESLPKELQKEGQVHFVKVNVTDEKNVSEGINEAVKQFGDIRGCIHCAGIALPAKVLNKKGEPSNLDFFKKVIEINLYGSFNILSLVAAAMFKNERIQEERGSIVLVSSVASFEGQIGQCSYSASKGGISSMVLPAARELGEHGIRVNAIAPGVFWTPLVEKLDEKNIKKLEASVPFPKRMGSPDEFADICLSFLSNQYYNGGVVRIDGGLRMSSL